MSDAHKQVIPVIAHCWTFSRRPAHLSVKSMTSYPLVFVRDAHRWRRRHLAIVADAHRKLRLRLAAEDALRRWKDALTTLRLSRRLRSHHHESLWLPEEFISFQCPISYELMCDPVVMADGHSYEKSNIEAWLQHHDSSPMTGAALQQQKWSCPNHTLRAAINEYLQQRSQIAGPGSWAALEVKRRASSARQKVASNATNESSAVPAEDQQAERRAPERRRLTLFCRVVKEATFLIYCIFVAVLLSAAATVVGGLMGTFWEPCKFALSSECRDLIRVGAHCGPAVLLPIHACAVMKMKQLSRAGLAGWFTGSALSLAVVYGRYHPHTVLWIRSGQNVMFRMP